MPRQRRYTEQQVREAVKQSLSITAALRCLGLRAAGGNFATMRKLIAEYRIPTDHFDPNWTRRAPERQTAVPLCEVLVEGSHYSRDDLKRRLYDEGIKLRTCELCGQGEGWRGRKMSLILDHINGVPTDNRIENVRIVCPNCAATLDTHCGRKNRREREPRACLHCGTSFTPRYETHRYCSQLCGSTQQGTPVTTARETQSPPPHPRAAHDGPPVDELPRSRS
jgi:hypothetical protein